MNNQSDVFNYTYSARDREEIKRIREKYTQQNKKEEDKMDRIRRLDAKAQGAAETWSIVFGIVGVLTLGFGMSLCMTELSSMLGLSRAMSMIIGCSVGFVGGALASLAYPVYNFTLRKNKAKIAPEILRLTEELLEEQI